MRQKLRKKAFNVELFGDRSGNALFIARQHHGANEHGLEFGNGLFCIPLKRIGDNDVTHVFLFTRQVHDSALLVTIFIGNTELLHIFGIAQKDLLTVHLGANASAGNLLRACHPLRIRLLAVCQAQGFGNRVHGKHFGKRCRFEHLGFIHHIAVDGSDRKLSLGKRAGFVKSNGFDFGERFQIVGALD